MSGNHDHSNGCCSSGKSIKLDVKLGELVATLPRPKPKPRSNPVPQGETRLAYYVGVDVGSTTVKSVIVDANTDQIARVVRNLLDNAASHADSTVRVALFETPSAITLQVSDDGPGVPAEARERIFERFARLDDARSRDNGGTGLGIAIVREVIEAHGGTITVDEPPGATFTVIMPLRDIVDDGESGV